MNKISVLILIAIISQTLAHYYMTSPEATFYGEGIQKTPVARFLSDKWGCANGLTNCDNSGTTPSKFASYISSSGLTLHEFLTTQSSYIDSISAKNSDALCGNSKYPDTSVAVPSTNTFTMSELPSIGSFLSSINAAIYHEGPCELLVDGKQVFFNSNCSSLAGNSYTLQVDNAYASCSTSACKVNFISIATQNPGYEIFANCACVGTGSCTSSSTTISSTTSSSNSSTTSTTSSTNTTSSSSTNSSSSTVASGNCSETKRYYCSSSTAFVMCDDSIDEPMTCAPGTVCIDTDTAIECGFASTSSTDDNSLTSDAIRTSILLAAFFVSFASVIIN